MSSDSGKFHAIERIKSELCAMSGSMPGSLPSTGRNSVNDFQTSYSASHTTGLATATTSLVTSQERQQGPTVSNQVPAVQGSSYHMGYVPGHQRLPSNQPMNNGMSANMGNSLNNTNNIANHMNNSVMNLSNYPIAMNGPTCMNSNTKNKSITGVGNTVQPTHSSRFGGSCRGFVSETLNRIAPYPSPQQHMAQKRPGMQHCEATGSQHNFNATQQPVIPVNQQQHNPPVQPQAINYTGFTAWPSSTRSQSNPYVNQGGGPPPYPQSQMNGTPPHQAPAHNQYPPQTMQDTNGTVENSESLFDDIEILLDTTNESHQNNLNNNKLHTEKLPSVEEVPSSTQDLYTCCLNKLTAEKKLIAEMKKTTSDLQGILEEKENLMCLIEEQRSREKDKVSKEEFAKLLEGDLFCNICFEIYIQATTLGCSHTFCQYCIDSWKSKRKSCPICREDIVTETRILLLDNFIDRIVELLGGDYKKNRQEVAQSRLKEKRVGEIIGLLTAPSPELHILHN